MLLLALNMPKYLQQWFQSLGIVLLLSSSLMMLSIPANSDILDSSWKFTTGIETGAENASFKWSIASALDQNTTPNILSELSYDSLIIRKQRFFLTLQRDQQWRYHVSSEFGLIDDGVIRDSDYDGNHRTGEYSRSLSDAKGSKIYELDAIIGYNIINQLNFNVEAQFGFSWKHQSFRKREGEQVISSPGRTLSPGSIEGLDSRYAAHWFGPSIGVQPRFTYGKHEFSFTQHFYLSQYYAEADWNLRSDFAHPKSFEHNANGYGSSTKIAYLWSYNEHLDLNLNVQWENWRTKDGTDTLFFANGSSVDTRLNETRWKTQGISVGLDWKL